MPPGRVGLTQRHMAGVPIRWHLKPQQALQQAACQPPHHHHIKPWCKHTSPCRSLCSMDQALLGLHTRSIRQPHLHSFMGSTQAQRQERQATYRCTERVQRGTATVQLAPRKPTRTGGQSQGQGTYVPWSVGIIVCFTLTLTKACSSWTAAGSCGTSLSTKRSCCASEMGPHNSCQGPASAVLLSSSMSFGRCLTLALWPKPWQ